MTEIQVTMVMKRRKIFSGSQRTRRKPSRQPRTMKGRQQRSVANV